MEKRFAGPRGVTIQGLMAGTLDITQNNWGHKVSIFTIHDYIQIYLVFLNLQNVFNELIDNQNHCWSFNR